MTKNLQYTFYEIVCKDENKDFIYIGSTKDFKNRKYQHKSSSININNPKNNLQVYQFIRENGGWNNFDMNPIEIYECETKTHARIREQYWIELKKSKLNKYKAFVPEEERLENKLKYQKCYYENHKEKIKEYNIIYQEKNAEQINIQKKQFYEQNKEKIKEHRKQFYEQNKDQIKEYQKQYNEQNKEYLKQYNKEYRKQYYELNKEKLKIKGKENYNSRKERLQSIKDDSVAVYVN